MVDKVYYDNGKYVKVIIDLDEEERQIKNVKIVNSYLIHSKTDKVNIICNIKAEFILHKYKFGRSVKSCLREWKAHNVLYRLHICRKSTVDTDLYYKESRFRRFCYFFISIFE